MHKCGAAQHSAAAMGHQAASVVRFIGECTPATTHTCDTATATARSELAPQLLTITTGSAATLSLSLHPARACCVQGTGCYAPGTPADGGPVGRGGPPNEPDEGPIGRGPANPAGGGGGPPRPPCRRHTATYNVTPHLQCYRKKLGVGAVLIGHSSHTYG